jgi:hypothetical protein
MTTPNLTPAEAATVARFDAAPAAPESWSAGRERADQLARILADVLTDNSLTCDPHPTNPRCACSTARALRVLNGEEEW